MTLLAKKRGNKEQEKTFVDDRISSSSESKDKFSLHGSVVMI